MRLPDAMKQKLPVSFEVFPPKTDKGMKGLLRIRRRASKRSSGAIDPDGGQRQENEAGCFQSRRPSSEQCVSRRQCDAA